MPRPLCLAHYLTLCFLLAAANIRAVSPALPVIPAGIFNITNYGAIGDGTFTNTAAISNTIAAANTAGGGTVVIPAGIFLSGPIRLANNLSLQLDTGATLLALPYGSYALVTNASSTNYSSFITASNLHDVQISGSGTIDGQGAAWWAALSANTLPAARPLLLQFLGCTRMLIQGVSIQNAPTTHVSVKGIGGDLTIRGITISTPVSAPDNTGIDMAATNCLIANNSISIGRDDNMQVGSSTAPAADIVITNCAFGDGHGLSIGSQTGGGVSNLLAINCTFNGTQAGIRLKSDRDRGGLVQKLSYLNLTMTSVRVPITISSYYNSFGMPNNVTPAIAATNTAMAVTNTTPIWRDITISNLTATTQAGYPAGIIWGRPEMTASNFTLTKLNISASKSFDIYNARGIRLVDSQITLPGGVPTCTLFNADVAISNSIPGATVSLDGLTTNLATGNPIALYNVTATMANTNTFGIGPFTLGNGGTLAANSGLSVSAQTVCNFAIGTNGGRIVVTGSFRQQDAPPYHLNLTTAPGFGPGTYPLIIYTSTAWSKAPPALDSAPPGYGYYVVDPSSQINLLVSNQVPPTVSNTVTSPVGGTNRVIFSGGGGAPQNTFHILTSTNVTLPPAQWTVASTNRFDAQGRFSTTNVVVTNSARLFYRLRLP